MVNVLFNLESQRFEVVYDSRKLSKTEIIKTVEEAGSFQVEKWQLKLLTR